MDLSQTKLTRAEWNSIEIPTEKKELDIINLICKGYHNNTIRKNNTLSLLTYLKIKESAIIHEYIYCTYLQNEICKIFKKYNISVTKITYKKNKMKKADIIRFSNADRQLEQYKKDIFEFIILNSVVEMLSAYKKENDSWQKYYYTIHILMSYNIESINTIFKNKMFELMQKLHEEISMKYILKHADTIIEKNSKLLTYDDIKLYDHQKEIFKICKHSHPKLISYIAPTGTGKTLTPLGLSENNRIIFVCAARHVGLALAKAAISKEKNVAFAFGCNSPDDIRLHYFSAIDYIRNKRSGMIAKVDNTVGDKVEIMICDIKSYTCAMHYMLGFNKKENIIMYWDEPTITMDYNAHTIHSIIQNNWKENVIPNVVLSSATLPSNEELRDVINDFKDKFDGAKSYSIASFDCKKTIPILNKECYVEMPHYIAETHADLIDILEHCEKNKTLLRYMDLSEAIAVIMYMNKYNYVNNDNDTIEKCFHTIDQVNMLNIKMNYLRIIKATTATQWEELKEHFDNVRKPRMKSNIHIVTNDAYTLTDGPTIFLADDVNKMATYCINSANIPDRVEKDIMASIEYNNVLTSRIDGMQKTLEEGTKKDEEKEKKLSDGRVAPAMKQLIEKISIMQKNVKNVELNRLFVPNTKEHLEKYCKDSNNKNKPFTCNIDEAVVEKIMLIHNVDRKWRLLLLMGIGVFTTHNSIEYMEIMKELAQKQKLYMIIASSDFIYGTNYQFCHSYISKDLSYMTNEKCIQAMGRVGRNNLQYDYTIRFRDNALIKQLFHNELDKPEVYNMNKLLRN